MVYDWQGYHCNLELIYDSLKKVGLAQEVNFFTIDSHSCYSPTRFDLVYTIQVLDRDTLKLKGTVLQI